MVELLMECHERELMKHEPCDFANTHYSRGLIERGLLETKDFFTQKGKQIKGLFITGLGREYLRSLK